MTVKALHGDSRDVLPTLAAESFHACVTDPPYSLVSIQKRFGRPGSAAAQFGRDGAYRRAAAGFMGQQWDTGETAFDPAFWQEVLRVLKPGAHLLAFGGTRTFHRLVCAIEDAGAEIRDSIAWLYGSGFPKSHDISKAIDRQAGAERTVIGTEVLTNDIRSGGYLDAAPGKRPGYQRDITADATDEACQWSGWGTALKPAMELIVVARKPLGGKTVAANVLAHGTGALNIDGCRVASSPDDASGSWGDGRRPGGFGNVGADKGQSAPNGRKHELGRWPANVIHDGSEEVIAAFPESAGQQRDTGPQFGRHASVYGKYAGASEHQARGDSGSAARFFYSPKADAGDRLGSKHPTVKPVDLMAYLCRLVTPPGGTVLDPFAGSGTTGMACLREGFDAILIEREAEYVTDIRRRLDHVAGADTPLFDQSMTTEEKRQDSIANYELALEAMRHKDDKP